MLLRIYFLLFLFLIFQSYSIAGSTENAIKKHGVHKVALNLLAHIRTQLPLVLDDITTFTEADYSRTLKGYDFRIVIPDSALDTVLEQGLNDQPPKSEADIKIMKELVYAVEKELFLFVTTDERPKQIAYYCNHENFGALIRHGVFIKFTCIGR